MRALTLFVLLAALTSGAASAQFGSGAFVQQLVASPYVQALGEATIGLRGYPGAAQLNPASIGRQDVVQGTINFHPGETVLLKTPWLPGFFGEPTLLYVMAPSIDVKLGDWAFGYMYREMSFGTHEGRDAQNNPTGRMRSYDAVHKITAAHDLVDNLAVGLSINYVTSRFGQASVGLQRRRETSAVSLDLGLLYEQALETPHVRIEPTVAWSLTDFGTKLDYPGSPTPLPLTMRGGAAIRVSTQVRPLSRPLISVTLVGALSQEIEQVELDETPDGTQPDIVSPFAALFTGWKSIQFRTNPTSEEIPEFETISVWEQTRRHGGIEVALWDVLFMRWGTQYEHPRMGTRDFNSSAWGIDLYYVVFERATVDGDPGAYREYTTSTLTVRVPLRQTTANFWIPLWRRIVK